MVGALRNGGTDGIFTERWDGNVWSKVTPAAVGGGVGCQNSCMTGEQGVPGCLPRPRCQFLSADSRRRVS